MPFLNGAYPAGSVGVDTIDLVEDWFQRRGARPVFRLRTDVDDPVIKNLGMRGYQVARIEPSLFMSAPAVPEYTGPLELCAVATPGQLAEVVEKIGGPDRIPETIGEFGYSMSVKILSMTGICEIWGFLGEELVAGAAMISTPPVAGIYAVFVEQEHRRQGFGAAVTWAAIRSGLEMGANSAWLGSTEIALSMYQGMGFVQVGEYQMLERVPGR